MRVLHLLKHGADSNGSVHMAVDLACAQAARGHDVTFAAARVHHADLLRDNGVRVVELAEPADARGAATSAIGLWRLCRDLRPDLVHAHMMSSVVLAHPVCRVLGIPLITTMHNSFDRHSVLMRLGRVVVAVSEAERRLLLDRGYPPRKLVTILNGTGGSPRESLAADDPPLARPCVLAVSGLHRRKAVGDVISAFALVSDEHPDWHLNIVGWGADRPQLELQVADLRLGERVHLLGPSTAPRALFEQADVFATATLADPCPLTVMEARTAGCAIVATAVGGIPETLGHGRHGQLVPTHDPAAMAAGFRTLMEDRVVLDGWRERSLDGADYFSVDRMAADYLDLYGSVVDRPRSGARR